MRSLVWRHSFVCLSFSGSTGESRTSLWIARSRGCVIIALECKFVILNEVKNLIRSMCYKTEILRLGPQNDIATQPPSRGMTFLSAWFFVIPAEAGIQTLEVKIFANL